MMGTAKARRQADILELLTQQHDKVDALIARLEDDVELEGEAKLRVFRELADNLAAHAGMEEQLFYPAVLAKQTEDILLESTEAHLAMKRVLADLLETAVDDDRFDARLKVLKAEVTHHAREEEEGKLFPKLRRLMSEQELVVLGAECLSLFERLMASEPRTLLPKQIDKPVVL